MTPGRALSILILLSTPAFSTNELTESQMIESIRTTPTIALWGHGSKGQIADPEGTIARLGDAVDRYNQKFGEGGWQFIYDGDAANAEKPNIGIVAKAAREQFGVRLLAVTFDKVRDKWGGVPEYVDAVYYMDTVEKPDGKLNWKVVSEFYFQNAMTDANRHLLQGVALFGGGPIALEQSIRAAHAEIEVVFHLVMARYPDVTGVRGSVFEALKANSLLSSCSVVPQKAFVGPSPLARLYENCHSRNPR